MFAGARAAALAAWSSGMPAPGAPCAMIPGTWRTRRLYVASWAVAGLRVPWWGPPLGRALGLCGWMRWGAGAMRRLCGTVRRSHGGAETVDTRRTQAYAVPVSALGWGTGCWGVPLARCRPRPWGSLPCWGPLGLSGPGHRLPPWLFPRLGGAVALLQGSG